MVGLEPGYSIGNAFVKFGKIFPSVLLQYTVQNPAHCPFRKQLLLFNKVSVLNITSVLKLHVHYIIFLMVL